MKEATYITILGWMRELPLSLVERTVYAIIYGFSQDGDSTFHGSRQYLADWCGCTTKTIDAALRSLIEKKLIRKYEKYNNGLKFCEYTANFPGREIFSPVGKFTDEGREIFSQGRENTSHNNIDNNADKSANSDKGASTSFDFKKAVMGMGVTQQHAEDWMVVRKAKRMTNTRTAFDRLKTQIENACKEYGITPDDCVAYAASKDWGGFDAKWEDVKNIKTNNYGISKEDRVRAAIDAEVARFAKPLHFGVNPKDQQ